MTAHLEECLRLIKETIDSSADVKNGVIRFIDYDEMHNIEYIELNEEQAIEYIENIRGGP